MEKKTIGGFISILRRAHGMTQKELGERLFVSDKTVSRWERDECTPELSLIPVIADLFGVTVDELLRGERKSDGTSASEEKPSLKSEKSYRCLMQKRITGFKNLRLIALAVASLGIVAALICNLGFTQATLGFGLGSVFLIAGTVCLICAFNHFCLRGDDDEENVQERNFNAHLIILCKNAAYILLAMFGTLLPLLFVPAHMGLRAAWWLVLGGGTALLLYLAASFAYEFFLKIHWIKKGFPLADDRAIALRNARMRLLKKLGTVGLSIALVFLLAVAAVQTLSPYDIQQPLTFQTFEDFRTFAENTTQYYYRDESGNFVIVEEFETEILLGGDKESGEDPKKPVNPQEVYNHKDELVYCYDQRNNSILTVEFSFSEENPSGLPIRVCTLATLAQARVWIKNLSELLLLAILLDFAVCCVIYLVKRRMKI